MTFHVEHLFMCLLVIYMSSLGKCLFTSSSFFKLGYVFCLCWVVWAVYLFCTLTPYQLVQFSRSVVYDSLWRYGPQHARLPCPSLSPRVCSNSCSLSQWRHPIISSSVALFSCPQSFPASASLPVSQLFASGGQSIGASTSASVPPTNIQGSFLLVWTGLISLLSKGLSRVFSNTTVQKHQFFGAQPSLWSNSHIHTWLLEKS